MKRTITSLFVIIALASCNSTDAKKLEVKPTESEAIQSVTKANLVEINTDEALIATALMSAPEGSRAESKVIGYNMKGDFVTLKEGTNEFICLADDPKKEGFSAACYHKNLEPFMAEL